MSTTRRRSDTLPSVTPEPVGSFFLPLSLSLSLSLPSNMTESDKEVRHLHWVAVISYCKHKVKSDMLTSNKVKVVRL